MSYVYMKVLESSPQRYDRGMRLLTLGRLEQAHRDIAKRVKPGWRVLDIGCGTGTLAVLMAQRGADVVGIDVSPPMLAVANEKVCVAGLQARVELRELGVTELDRAFSDGGFDAVTSSLAFSELSDDEVAFALRQAHRLLRPSGWLMICDEVRPATTAGQLISWLVRFPFVVITFLLTQNTTSQVGNLSPRIEATGFRMVEVRRYLLGTLQTFVARKPRTSE
jgi:demethylmenaquinone methyltransferase/2-methoxy-6-polyprenyl-1,4-benzoquinol methylase